MNYFPYFMGTVWTCFIQMHATVIEVKTVYFLVKESYFVPANFTAILQNWAAFPKRTRAKHAKDPGTNNVDKTMQFKLLFVKRLINGKYGSSTEKTCPVFQAPIHGLITSLSCGSSFGSQAFFACDTGYRMAGSRLRSCRADRTWSGNVTTCNSK